MFGDQAYGASKGVMSPFRGGVKLTGAKRSFHDRMSIRISVEQEFGATQQKWMANLFESQMMVWITTSCCILLSISFWIQIFIFACEEIVLVADL